MIVLQLWFDKFVDIWRVCFCSEAAINQFGQGERRGDGRERRSFSQTQKSSSNRDASAVFVVCSRRRNWGLETIYVSDRGRGVRRVSEWVMLIDDLTGNLFAQLIYDENHLPAKQTDTRSVATWETLFSSRHAVAQLETSRVFVAELHNTNLHVEQHKEQSGAWWRQLATVQSRTGASPLPFQLLFLFWPRKHRSLSLSFFLSRH